MSSLSSSPSYRLFKVLYSFDAEGAEEMSVGKDDLVFGLYEGACVGGLAGPSYYAY